MSLRNRSAIASPWAKRRFPGRPDQVTCAREFVRQVLGSAPVAEDAVLLVSELSTNAVLHTASGDGGYFEVAVHISTARARIEVRDQGTGRRPTAEPTDTLAEAGGASASWSSSRPGGATPETTPEGQSSSSCPGKTRTDTAMRPPGVAARRALASRMKERPY